MSARDNARFPLAEAVRAAYRAGEEDETLEPISLVDSGQNPVGRVQDGDYVIFYDIRGEREVELTRAFTDAGFSEFPTAPMKVHFTTLIQYHPDLNVAVAFPPAGQIEDTLSHVVAAAGRRQIKICESEKAVHVSFFFNGKSNESLPGEDRVIVHSPSVNDYSQVPSLAARDVTAKIHDALHGGEYDLIIANYANVDVIGHIENPAAIREAIEAVDHEVGEIVRAAALAGVTTIITADHGTVERWTYPDGAIDTGHTDSPVPFILISPDGRSIPLRPVGELMDVAPTVLQLLGLNAPAAMTGKSLLMAAPRHAPTRVLLVILDGWGYRDESAGNLIDQANTPNMSRLLAEQPVARLQAAGPAVGMPAGTVGNSEVGHLHMGAGRRIYSDRVRIDRGIEDRSFFQNPAFMEAMRGSVRDGARLHLLGIVSFYSSHGSVRHLKALMKMAKEQGVSDLYIHGMLGRRGERPESGAIYMEDIEREAEKIGLGQVVSVIGRYWSLDREGNWDRIEKTYRWLVHGEGARVPVV